MSSTKSPKNSVVILLTDRDGPVYLGELDRGLRQGVRQLSNACRFTERGAARIASGYTSPRAEASKVSS